MYRRTGNSFEVFLVHPGGPFFTRKDAGVWTIPKGEPDEGEDLLLCARREFLEETGITPREPFLCLGEIRQKGGKTVHAWAFAGDWRAEEGLSSNFFEIEWPPRSGRRQSFPEVDRAEWFSLEDARTRINPAQAVFLDRLQELLPP